MCVCVWGGGGGGGGAGGQVVQVFVLGHEFESHHSQMNIDHSSSPASHHPHQSLQSLFLVELASYL